MNRKRKAIVALANWLSVQLNGFLNESSSDSDDEEILLIVKKNKKGRKKPVRISGYFENVIPRFTDKEFQMHFRMNSNTFENLLLMLFPYFDAKQTGRPLGDYRKKLLAIIWLLATPDSFRSIGDRFDMSKGNIFDDFVRVVTVLNRIAPTIIKWPSNEEKEAIKIGFQRFGGLRNVIGAVDGVYIPICAPSQDPEVYVTRKCNYAITLQAISIPSLKFIDTFAGYPGSVSDARIFQNSFIYRNISQNINNYCENSYLLGDKAYPLHSWIIPPYIERRPLTPMQRNFNLMHARTRQVIERSFGLLLGRFRRLKYLDMKRTDLIPATINACCVLHNICIDLLDPDHVQYLQEGMEFFVNNVDNVEIAGNDLQNADGNNLRDMLAQELFNEINL